MSRHVAIVGGGYSGTLLAIHLLRDESERVTLIERRADVGRGTAYSTGRPEHLLNVRAAGMSALADEPDHFVRWLAARGRTEDGTGFVPRMVYGDYLQDMLAEARAPAGARLATLPAEVVDINGDGPLQLTLADGRTLSADAAVLAIGNLPPGVPPGLAAVAGSPRLFADPWAPGVTDDLDDHDPVLLVGTGLTMVDVALTLDAQGFRGPILALSRRGLAPHGHEPTPPNPEPRRSPPPAALSTLVGAIRRRARDIGWRNAVDELRPFTQTLWAGAGDAERARFLCHLRPWWDIHRHRLASPVAERIAALRAAGQLTIAGGKIVRAVETDAGIAVDWRPRGAAGSERLTAQRIVNCTGPESNLARTADPLLATLAARGTIRPDRRRIGIDINAAGHTLSAAGHTNNALFAVGPMTRGAWWEIVAVPDIRQQVAALAARLAG